MVINISQPYFLIRISSTYIAVLKRNTHIRIADTYIFHIYSSSTRGVTSRPGGSHDTFAPPGIVLERC